MFRSLQRFLVAAAIGWSVTAGSFVQSADRAATYDVVIYGGTSAGIAAAVQTVRQGKTVVVIEPSGHLGGLTTSGLGWTDTGNKAAIGGIAREFYQAVKRHYDQPSAWKYESADDYDRYRPADDAMWTFEPHVAAAIFERWLADAKVPVVLNQRLDRGDGITIHDGRIQSIRTESGQTFRGLMFIDATYEGDLMALAGVTYTVGRESNAKYNEQLNGVQKDQNVHNHRFLKPVDPYVRPGDSTSGVLPGIQTDGPGEDGAGDHRVQAYCYRMCMSNVPENRVPFEKPDGYDQQRYELLLRNFEAGDLRVPLSPGMLPNGKTDTNNNGAFSTDNIGMNYDYPEADYETRQRILEEHLRYQQGLMWTLANHPRVPASVREEMAQWGLAADEFEDSNHWPPQIYVREARRMVSDYVMTELDCRRVRLAKDSVGLGSYNMDSHNCQRYVTPDGHVQNEGDVQVSPGGAYQISYRSIIPTRKDCENLLVPVCLSSSHIAYGSIRMEPVFMILGQSAATAAVLALEQRIPLQQLRYDTLRDRLLADGQVLDLPPGSTPKITITAANLPGIVLDDVAAKFAGAWPSSSSATPYIESGYRHDNNELKGEKSAIFQQMLEPGEYEVRLAYTYASNRATNVPVTIRTADGQRQIKVNQRRQPPIEKLFVSLGVFRFDQSPAEVTIGTNDTDGHVVVDGVQFLAR
ncbi:MAG: FAD-dependent oxidoreductase [Pirellulaceae bacterium]